MGAPKLMASRVFFARLQLHEIDIAAHRRIDNLNKFVPVLKLIQKHTVHVFELLRRPVHDQRLACPPRATLTGKTACLFRVNKCQRLFRDVRRAPARRIAVVVAPERDDALQRGVFVAAAKR